MASIIPHPTIRPRSLANVLCDLREARSDWQQALADAERAAAEGDEHMEAEHGDRMSEADTRIDDLTAELKDRFVDATGLSLKNFRDAIEELLL